MSDPENNKEVMDGIEEILSIYNIQLETQARADAVEKGDYNGIISETQMRLDELKERAEKMRQESGMTEEQLDEYASNRANFSAQEWQLLEETRAACKEMEAKSAEMMANKMRQELHSEAESEVPKKKKKKGSDQFAKKKKWLQM